MPIKDPIKAKAYHKRKSREFYLANKAECNERTSKRYWENKAYHNAYTRLKEKELKYEILAHYSDEDFPCALVVEKIT
jgi:hypothetical protein